MLTRREYLLTCLAEEGVEIAQRATKALRFGLFETQSEKDGTTFRSNLYRLAEEIIDLETVLGMLEDTGVDFNEQFPGRALADAIAKKRAKIEKYLAYAWHDCGTTERQPIPSREGLLHFDFYKGTMAKFCEMTGCEICAERLKAAKSKGEHECLVLGCETCVEPKDDECWAMFGADVRRFPRFCNLPKDAPIHLWGNVRFHRFISKKEWELNHSK